MLNSCSYNNNVRSVTNASIVTTDTSIAIVEAVSPFNNPPTTTSTAKPAYFTIVDNPSNPTMVEIVRCTGVSAPNPLSGVVTLSGVTRGVDGTSARDWPGGSVVMQSMNKAALNPAAISGIEAESFVGLFGNTAAQWGYAILTHPDGVIIKPAGGGLFLLTEGIETTGLRCIQGRFNNCEVSNELTVTGILYSNGQTVAASLRLTASAPPTAASPGNPGEIRVAGNYIYVCTATNTWRRAALSTW